MTSFLTPFTGKQVFRPATVRKRHNKATINFPADCRDIKYVRYILPDDRMYFVPSNTPRPETVGSEIRGNPVVPKQDGYRTYVSMPPRLVGSRYRRILDKSTGVVELTPIYRPEVRA